MVPAQPLMAIKHLSDEQIRTWTLEQKDRWWLDNVWKGDMPQLTLRSGLTGMFIGGILSLTNLYVGAKTGWTLGVGITSVILAFAAFKLLSAVGLGKDFTLLENNAMQSIATAAGYMTAPMISSLAAYMMVTNQVIPMMHTLIWIVAIAILGVLFAFPLKRRFINDEQHPFPEGRAAGIVMDALHTGDAASGLLKAKLLAVTGGAVRPAEAHAERGHHDQTPPEHAHRAGVSRRLGLPPGNAQDLRHRPAPIDRAARYRFRDDGGGRAHGHPHRRFAHGRRGHQLPHPGAR